MNYTQEREAFIARVAQEGLPLTVIRTILAKANTLQRIAELQCSSALADRDRVKCPGDPSRKFGKGECLCDQYECDCGHAQSRHSEDGCESCAELYGVMSECTGFLPKHSTVPRIDVQEAQIKRQLDKLMVGRKAWRIVDTWNGGSGGRKIVFTTTNENDLMPWFHRNTSFSMDEAIKHQGYVIEHCGFHLNYQGDPRGAVVKLAVPSGAYDDLSKEGLCVPAKGLPTRYWEQEERIMAGIYQMERRTA